MSDEKPSRQSTAPLRILVVDDKEKVRESLSLSLRHRGFSPLSASNEEEAWKAINTDTVDLALIDVMLGKDNGLELLKKIRDLDPPVPVLIFTGYGTIETAIEAINLGAFNYLQKPVKMDHLVPMINAAVRLKYLEEENRELQSRIKVCENTQENQIINFPGNRHERNERNSGRLHQEMEEDLIRKVLSECGGNKKRCAEVLGISRATLYNKIKEYGLT